MLESDVVVVSGLGCVASGSVAGDCSTGSLTTSADELVAVLGT